MQYLEKNGIYKMKNYKSPIYKIEELNQNEIYIMRDDLIPFSFGGNKARKAYYFFDEILKKDYNYIITYGSAGSNHCRIIANLAAKYKIKCTIISTEKEEETNNKIMCEKFGVEFVYCKVENVKQTINEQMKDKETKKYRPYFIQGGGHGNLGTQAYIDAYEEIIEFENKNKLGFNYIFHASGTGTTQAGLILGNMLNNHNAEIIGISIARKLIKGRDVIVNSIEEYIKEFKINKTVSQEKIKFVDDYVLGGYGKYNEEIISEISHILVNHGIPMDTTYTGKAYFGMKRYIIDHNIKNSKILFIHTGGTPIFFDKIKEI